MTTKLIVAVILFNTLLCRSGAQANEPVTAEKQITETLHQMYEAEKRRDLPFVLSHLAEDFAEVAGDGAIYHRADIETGWNDVSLSGYSLTDCVFKLVTPDAAYLSCRMEVAATYKGQPLPGLFRVTTLWTHQNDRWLIRFEQGTIIPGSSPKK
jgi:ketosteroid isomerase-like protein